MMPIQPGDIHRTWTDIASLENDFEYKPKTTIETGVNLFADWFKEYSGKNMAKL